MYQEAISELSVGERHWCNDTELALKQPAEHQKRQVNRDGA